MEALCRYETVPEARGSACDGSETRDAMTVHDVLVDPREEVKQKTVPAMRTVTAGHWGPCETRLQVKAKPQAVQWIGGPDRTGSNGVADKNLGA